MIAKEIYNLKDINKSYISNNSIINVLSNINLSINRHEKIAVVGPSGSGKSTFLKLLSTLELPTSGDIIYDDSINIAHLTIKQRSELRLSRYGLINQNNNLIHSLTAKDNIVLLSYATKEKIDTDYLLSIADKLNILNRLSHYPYQLSGGEQQRVAIARAIVRDPDVIFADELTGNLDEKTSQEVMELLCECIRGKTTLIYATHDLGILKYADKIMHIKDGSLYRD